MTPLERPGESIPARCASRGKVVSRLPESIDFYVTGTTSESARGQLACRLAEKAYERGMHVFIAVAGNDAAAHIDDLLWTFRQGSFIPHGRADTGDDEAQHPVLIGTGPAPETHRDILIVLRDEVPDGYRHAGRVIEIVSGDSGDRSRARARFRYYREQGLDPITHEIDP